MISERGLQAPAAVDNPQGLATKERILAVAEQLFAEYGLTGVSLRTITSLAGVNLAAVHYHFGSKDALFEEIFARHAGPMAARRLALLEQCAEGPARPPLLEQIIAAFLIPGLEVSRGPGTEGTAFLRLRARLACESNAFGRRILSHAFDHSSSRYLEALHRALPDLPLEELQWRFHFLLGTMVYTMANSGRIQALTNGACDPGDIGRALQHLVPFLAAGFRSPAVVYEASFSSGSEKKRDA